MSAVNEPNRVTSLTETTTHVRDGLALFSQQFQGKERITALATALFTQVQEAESALFDLYGDGLDTATDAQLDQIGELLGRPRAGLSDDNYRLVLQGTAIAIASSGTVDDLYRIADILLKTVAFTITEPSIATVKIDPDSTITMGPTLALEVLARARAAGVRLLLVDPRGDESGHFRFSETSETVTDSSRGLSDTGATTGGRLVGILEA